MSSQESFPIDAAQIIGLFMESVFYGVYLVTFFHCIKVLFWRDGALKPWHKMHIKMAVAALLMFTFATLDVGFHVRHAVEIFVGISSSEEVIAAFNETSNWLNVMKMVCYVAQTFVGDFVLVYRCWIIWNRNWLIIIPSTLLWLGCTVCGAMTIYVQATFDTKGALLNSELLVPFITGMLTLTLVANSVTTGLIVFKIWKIQNRLKRRSTYALGSPLSRLLVVLIESGLIYTMSIIVLFILYLCEHNGQYGVSNAVVQIIGITFNLIITSADRKENSSMEYTGSDAVSGRNTTVNMVPLQAIHVQTVTSVSRYPVFDEEAKGSAGADDVSDRSIPRPPEARWK